MLLRHFRSWIFVGTVRVGIKRLGFLGIFESSAPAYPTKTEIGALGSVNGSAFLKHRPPTRAQKLP